MKSINGMVLVALSKQVSQFPYPNITEAIPRVFIFCLSSLMMWLQKIYKEQYNIETWDAGVLCLLSQPFL